MRKKNALKKSQRVLKFPCHSKYLAVVRQAILSIWKSQKLPLAQGQLVALAVDEAVSSIIQHALGMKRPDGRITVRLSLDRVCFKAIIEDQTNGFDLNLLSARKQKLILTKEKRYQLGVFLICAIMDEVFYNYKKGFQNEWQLIKFIVR